MRTRLLDFLCCPNCQTSFDLDSSAVDGEEILTGVLICKNGHYFPVVGGIPRMLENSMAEYWPQIKDDLPVTLREILATICGDHGQPAQMYHDRRTKANFSNEWDNHEVGGKTWGMNLNDRIQWFFLDPIRIPAEKLEGKILLDAGCGNGSQSVAYTKFGLEVIALDLSSGLEKGYAFRERYKQGIRENVHFVQADLRNPPVMPDSVDLIHSAGVLHHTPNTESTFRAICPTLKIGGTYYVWLYKYERIVTPLVNAIRAVTTRFPPRLFAATAVAGAVPFIGFCWLVDSLGLRAYEIPNFREATIALHDIFGAPYAHYHKFDEVAEWFRSEGFGDLWPCNDGRRGFGVCGRRTDA